MPHRHIGTFEPARTKEIFCLCLSRQGKRFVPLPERQRQACFAVIHAIDECEPGPDDFTVEDLVAFGDKYQVTNPKEVIQRTVEVFSGWAALAAQWNVAPNEILARASRLRLFAV